jgi:hypothetical protein
MMGLAPGKFVEMFRNYARGRFDISFNHARTFPEFQHVVQEQLQKQLPIPIIYTPIGNTVNAPHYATIIGVGIDKQGNTVYKIADSMSEKLPRNYLTAQELEACMSFHTLRSPENFLRDLSYRLFARTAQVHL